MHKSGENKQKIELVDAGGAAPSGSSSHGGGNGDGLSGSGWWTPSWDSDKIPKGGLDEKKMLHKSVTSESSGDDDDGEDGDDEDDLVA